MTILSSFAHLVQFLSSVETQKETSGAVQSNYWAFCCVLELISSAGEKLLLKVMHYIVLLPKM